MASGKLVDYDPLRAVYVNYPPSHEETDLRREAAGDNTHRRISASQHFTTAKRTTESNDEVTYVARKKVVYRDYGPPGGGGIWSRRKERKEYFAKLRAKGLLENLGFKICEEPFAEKYEAKYTAWLECAKKIVNKSGRQETCGILETSIESSS
ncbi:uncharacterized protein LOC125469580 [Pyrus x bretschneideri]|uniref:uncharacterized protein LOC125469580 n=1 Tax=Pyrus x bretschneideri TaxID=225117 RepID=UPI00202FF428|nr:uncharacterized protein LOC125469580 [Pyrus x bretschneideri]